MRLGSNMRDTEEASEARRHCLRRVHAGVGKTLEIILTQYKKAPTLR